jgi:hypothetical protein
MILASFLIITLLSIGVGLIRNRKKLSPSKVVDIVLLNFLFILVGLSGLMAFYGHMFLSDKIAISIGWATGSPFQLEVAMTNLAFGVLGVLCIRFRDGFWLATGVGYATFLFGAAYVHINEMIVAGNYAQNNAGAVLYLGDIAIPLMILILLLLRAKLHHGIKVLHGQAQAGAAGPG